MAELVSLTEEELNRILKRAKSLEDYQNSSRIFTELFDDLMIVLNEKGKKSGWFRKRIEYGDFSRMSMGMTIEYEKKSFVADAIILQYGPYEIPPKLMALVRVIGNLSIQRMEKLDEMDYMTKESDIVEIRKGLRKKEPYVLHLLDFASGRETEVFYKA